MAVAGVRAAAVALAVATASGGLAGASAAGLAVPSTAGNGAGAVWGNAQEFPGSATLNNGNATALSVSCPAAGDCAAGGQYSSSPGNSEPFVVNEVNGIWGNAEEVPGIGPLNVGEGALINSVSCGSPGNCSAGGVYLDGEGQVQAFVTGEVNGTWGDAIEVPRSGTLNVSGDASVDSIACGSAGNCSAGGTYDDSSGNNQAFVADEVNGSWSDATEVPGSGALNADGDASVDSVSCGSPGNCSAGGFYRDSSPSTQAFVVSEVNGSWGDAEEVPGSGALNADGQGYVLSVSCPTAGNCSAGGVYQDSSMSYQGYVVNEVNGTWGDAEEVPGSAALNVDGDARIASVSCPAAGDCTAGGYYGDGTTGLQVFVVGETNGIWGNAEEIPGSGTLNTGGDAALADSALISCAAPGDCAAGGSYKDSSNDTQAFVASEVDGTWGDAEEMPGSGALNASGSATVNAISCAAPGDCAAVGAYEDATHDSQAFVADQLDSSSTTLTLSPAHVVFGKTPAGKVSVTVTPSTASGTATVTARPAKGRAISLCDLTVTGGQGTCAPSATKLAAGTYSLVAVFRGSPALLGSASPARTLTVSAAKSFTGLTLSKTSVTYSAQSAERFSVTVGPQFTGQPAGKITVTAESAKGHQVQLCQVTLFRGKASCKLPAKRLPSGSYQVIAAYPGSTDFRASASAKRTLKITKSAA